MPEHPDLETLSAYHDGEAPELDAHVVNCAQCKATVAQFETLGRALKTEPDAMPSAAVDVAIGRALDAGAGLDLDAGAGLGPGSEPSEPAVASLAAHRGRRRWTVVASIAAAAVAVTAGAALLASGGSSGSRAATALRSPQQSSQAAPARNGIEGGAELASPPTASTAGDVGPIDSPAALAAAAGPAARAAESSATANDQAAAPAVPRTVGTRACELQARAADPNLGDVVYAATASYRGSPGVVLGFVPLGGGSPLSLFLLSADGCRLLVQTTVP